MKVEGVRMYGAKDLRLEEFEMPEIKDDEVLLKVMSDSICMSTWKEVKLGSGHIRVPDNIAEEPVLVGHELLGTICKVGKKWADEYKEGERFVVLPGIPDQMGAPGYSYPYFGGAVTYCIVPNDVIEKGCLLHYNGDAFFEVPVSEPMYCIIGGYNANYHTKSETHEHFIGAKEGENVLILGGCGPMGLGAVSYALAMKNKPKKVVVTEINDDRLARARKVISEEYAKEKGVELHYVNTAKMDDEVEELLKITDGVGYHDVFVYAPIRQIAEVGDKVMAFDGCMNLFAGPADSVFSAEMNLYNAHYKNTKILGSSGGIKTDLLEALDLIFKKEVNPAVMITHIGGLDAYADTTLHLPEIPGGKKLIYTQIHMPLTAIEDFRKMGEENELFTQLADACDKYQGLWNKEAEDILLKYYNVEV